MNKDVIYIDVDDDITAIIGKVKASTEKIVALVPPKRAGVLQSAVNLRLLDRMAKNDKKHLVVITNNPALIALTASAHIPVAKNLQSKPEIAEIPALSVDDGDDIIDGSELPVGDHAKSVSTVADDEVEAEKPSSAKKIPVASSSLLKTKPSRTDTLETLEIDGEAADVEAETSVSKPPKSAKSKVAIPDFNRFRKRLFLGIFIGVLVIAGLVWALVIAPSATITISASTTPAPVSATVKLGGTSATDTKAGVISSESQQLKKNATVQFTPTGTGQTGTKATGSVVFKNCESPTAETIPAGTTISTNGLNFTTQADASVPGATGFASCNSAGTSSAVAVSASDVGTDYNVASGTTFSVAGHNATNVTFYFKAVASTDFTGGDSKAITTVSDSDIQAALGQIQGQSTTAIQKQLTSQFTNGEIVIASSFTADQGTPTSAPASGQEVDNGAQATLTVPMTYTIYAFPKSGVQTYLDANLASQITSPKSQRVYDDGLANVGFSNFQKAADGSMTANITTTGQIGPQIDEATIKKEVGGKITGDVQSIVGGINGVQSVDVSYSYFWVTTVPSNPNKVDVEFKLVHA